MNNYKSRNLNRRKIIKRRRILVFIFIMLVLYLIFGNLYVISRKSKVIYLKNIGMGTYKIDKLKDIQEEYEKNLNIKIIDYNWESTFDSGNKPKYLVYHHTASSEATPKDINKNHVEKGWDGIGYHFYIRKDGTIYRGRPEETIGAHVYQRNRDTLGICLEGNFENEKPSDSQIESLVKLSSDMIMKYNIEDLMGHKDLYNTLCPGKGFDLEYVKLKVADEVIKNIKK